MKNLNKREKYMIIILGIAVVLYIYSKLFLLPVLDNIKASNQKISDYNNQLDQLKVAEITNGKMEKELVTVKVKYEDALSKLPTLEKNPEIAYDLKPLADKNKVNLVSIALSEGSLYSVKASNSTDTGNIYSVPVSVNVTSQDYKDLMQFVNSIETFKRIAEVTSFNITSQKAVQNSTTNTNTVASTNANMSINYFYSLNNNNEKPNYNFNKGIYGKPDLFK